VKTPELLDVDVDHVAGLVVLVPYDLAQPLPGGWVEVTQAVESPADEHAVHSGRGQCDAVQPLEVGCQAGRTVFGLTAQRLHEICDVFCGAGRARGWAGGAVEKSVLTVRAPAGVPLAQAPAGDAGFGGDVCDWESRLDA